MYTETTLKEGSKQPISPTWAAVLFSKRILLTMCPAAIRQVADVGLLFPSPEELYGVYVNCSRMNLRVRFQCLFECQCNFCYAFDSKSLHLIGDQLKENRIAICEHCYRTWKCTIKPKVQANKLRKRRSFFICRWRLPRRANTST